MTKTNKTKKNIKKKNTKKTVKKENITIRTRISYLILSVFLIGIGLFNLIYPYIGMEYLLFYTSMLFLLYAVVTFGCYMWARREGQYELLLLTVTNIIVALFLYLCRDGDVQIILGTAILAFFLQCIGVRLNQIMFLYKKKDNLFYAKLTTTILLTVLTALIIFNLYTGTTVQTFIFGYYFIVYGIIWLLDSCFYSVVNSKKFNMFINSK